MIEGFVALFLLGLATALVAFVIELAGGDPQ